MHFLLKCLFSVLFVFCLLSVQPAFCAPKEAGTDSPLPQAQRDISQIQKELLPDNQTFVPALVLQDNLLLTPYLEYYVDPTFSVDISEIATAQYADKFQLFSPDRLPLFQTGVTWLRFVLQPAQGTSAPVPLTLDIGTSVPGKAILYTPNLASGSLEWQEGHPTGTLLQLPQAVSAPLVCYLRLDGLPGWWFAPTVRTLQSAAVVDTDRYHQAALVALAVVFILCLLKGLSEPGQWRLWALLYLAAALLQTWSGFAPVNAGYSAQSLAALTSAGIALMLWPHVARHILSSRQISRFLDAQFILLCLPGAAAALLPLVPNFQWIARYIPLWPAAMAIFVPSALWAVLCGAPACLRFLFATALPPFAAAASILGLRFGFDPELLAALPAFGTALGALILLSLSRRQDALVTADVRQDQQPSTAGAALALDLGPHADTDPEPVVLDEPVEDSRETPGDREEDGLYGSILALLKKTDGSIRAWLTDSGCPDSCKKPTDTLLSSLQALTGELARLQEEDRLARENARKMPVILVSSDKAFCAVLTHVLRNQDCFIRVAANLEEALTFSRERAARMYIFAGEYASASVLPSLVALRKCCRTAGITPCFLAYTKDDSEWQALGEAGFTHALTLPIDDTSLINTLEELRQEMQNEPVADTVAAPAAEREEQVVPDIFGISQPVHSPRPVSPKDQPRIEQPVRSTGLPEPVSLVTQVQGKGLSEALRAELRQYISQAKVCLVRNNLAELTEQMQIIADKTRDIPAISRIAELVIKAASNTDKMAVRDLLMELTASIDRRLG